MYLNIVEYVDDYKQNELIEVIQMAVKIEGVIAKYLKKERDEGWNEGRDEGRCEGMFDIIVRLLDKYSVEDVSLMTGLDEDEIREILDKQ